MRFIFHRMLTAQTFTAATKGDENLSLKHGTKNEFCNATQ